MKNERTMPLEEERNTEQAAKKRIQDVIINQQQG